MKKALSIVFLLIISISLSSCVTSRMSAKEAMAEAMDAIKTFDVEKVREYMGEDSGLSDLESLYKEKEGGINKEQLSAIFNGLSYKIISSSEDKDIAKIEIEITNKDMNAVFDLYVEEAVSMLISEENENLTEDEKAGKLTELLLSLTEEEENYVTSSVTVNMNYDNRKWTIESDREFFTALMGGLDLASLA